MGYQTVLDVVTRYGGPVAVQALQEYVDERGGPQEYRFDDQFVGPEGQPPGTDSGVTNLPASGGGPVPANRRYLRWDSKLRRWVYTGPRKRRKRMLSCSDKADIAFLKGQLGGGELGKAVITSLIARCS